MRRSVPLVSALGGVLAVAGLMAVRTSAESADFGEQCGYRLLPLVGCRPPDGTRVGFDAAEPRILPQDRLLELPQRRAGLDPELLDEPPPRVLVDAERRVVLAAR